MTILIRLWYFGVIIVCTNHILHNAHTDWINMHLLFSCGKSGFVVKETILIGLTREWWLPWWEHGVLTRLRKFEPIENVLVVGMSVAGWEEVVVATGDILVDRLVGWEHMETLPGWRSNVELRPAELVDDTLSYPGLQVTPLAHAKIQPHPPGRMLPLGRFGIMINIIFSTQRSMA